jgi:hypothetical protein
MSEAYTGGCAGGAIRSESGNAAALPPFRTCKRKSHMI